MKELLKRFEEKRPEVVFEWKDAETEAEGWVVINSLRGGAAGGGTRMRKGLDKREVESLAKTMEIKFTVAGPPIGGAKSGINFDPADPRKRGVLERWYKAVMPLLKSYYGTGGDLNVDEIHEVIPITESFGLWHPQEGVINGHYHARESDRILQIGQLRKGVSKVIDNETFSPDVSRHYVVADMITGYGVSESVKHFYQQFNGTDLRGKRALIQGWGNVGAAAAFYLAQQGVKIVGIIDRVGGLLKPEGFSFEEIRTLFLNRKGNTLSAENLIPFEQINQQIWNTPAEIFVPAAASRLVSEEQVKSLLQAGLEVIASGANVPFADPEIFFGPIMEYADNNLSVIPDFLSNCGMARVFAYLMEPHVEITDAAIFADVSKVIEEAIGKVHQKSALKTGVSKTAFEIALQQLI
ncbi:MAG TPA: Glu/Leu/Phe/Val dehydrogenase dimerization domain-containing protein [Daejeonella sp.]|nr:Glu/Leu/Phe/Val dehydrogenase dimerization domain-containing protein [Daejeonella sp.]